MDSQTQSHKKANDAAILEQIFAGDLQSASIIEETQELEEIPLGEHPHYSKILQLARKVSSTEALNRPSLFENLTSSWRTSLEDLPFSKIAFQLFKKQATGFVRITHKDRTRVIVLSAGLPINASSNIDTERFGNFLLMRKAITETEATQAHELCNKKEIFLGAALLELNLVTIEELHRYLEQYSRFLLFPTFQWTHGQVDFFTEPKAMMMLPVINLSFMGIMRAGIWGNRPLDLATVKRVSNNLLHRTTKLILPNPLGTLEWELTDTERQVAQHLQTNKKLESLILDFSEPREQAKALLAAYLLLQIGVLEIQVAKSIQGLEIPQIQDPESTKQADYPKDSSDELNSYLKNKRVETTARKQLLAGEPQQALKTFQQLYTETPSSPDIMAYLGMATLLSDPKLNIKRAFSLAQSAIQAEPRNAVAHATISRCYEVMANENSAASHRQQAIQLSANNREWQTQIISLLNVGIRITSSVNTERKSAPLVGIFLGLLTLGALFWTSNILGFGEFEYQYNPSDRFFFARRISLVICGIIGICAFERSNPLPALSKLFRKFPVRYALYALLWGLLIGYISPTQQIRGGINAVLAMGVLHVIAEEIFFRGMVTRILLNQTTSSTVAIALSAALFGLYQLTYASAWLNLALSMKLYWVGVTTVAIGLPFAWLYSKTKTIWPSLIAYAICHLLVLWNSLLGTI